MNIGILIPTITISILFGYLLTLIIFLFISWHNSLNNFNIEIDENDINAII